MVARWQIWQGGEKSWNRVDFGMEIAVRPRSGKMLATRCIESATAEICKQTAERNQTERLLTVPRYEIRRR